MFVITDMGNDYVGASFMEMNTVTLIETLRQPTTIEFAGFVRKYKIIAQKTGFALARRDHHKTCLAIGVPNDYNISLQMSANAIFTLPDITDINAVENVIGKGYWDIVALPATKDNTSLIYYLSGALSSGEAMFGFLNLILVDENRTGFVNKVLAKLCHISYYHYEKP